MMRRAKNIQLLKISHFPRVVAPSARGAVRDLLLLPQR
jgi:hypothetical protein